MISFAAAAWFLVMPLWEVTDPTDWYEMQAEIIYEEPSLEDLEREMERQRFRIMLENLGGADGK